MMRLWIILGMLFTASAQAAEPIKIGDLEPFTGYSDGAAMERKGAELAMKEINAAGGVMGKSLEILFRDDHAEPAMAIKAAEALVDIDKVVMLTGTQFDHTGLAVNNFAKERKVLFFRHIGTSPKFSWQHGNRYAWRGGDTNTWYLAKAMADEAAKTKAKRWAFFAPNYEYGHSMVELFQKFLKEQRPDVEFVYEIFPETYKFNAAQSLRAAKSKKPDALFTVLFGSDHMELVRQGKKMKFFDDKTVFCGMCGLQAELEVTGKETPVGWLSAGYPAEEIDNPAHKKFVAAFKKAYGKTPYVESFYGYMMPYQVKEMIERAQSTDTETIIDKNKGKTVTTLLGPKPFNAFTNEVNAGFWLGYTGFKDGQPAFLNWRYVDPAGMYPGDQFVQELREKQ